MMPNTKLCAYCNKPVKFIDGQIMEHKNGLLGCIEELNRQILQYEIHQRILLSTMEALYKELGIEFPIKIAYKE